MFLDFLFNKIAGVISRKQTFVIINRTDTLCITELFVFAAKLRAAVLVV